MWKWYKIPKGSERRRRCVVCTRGVAVGGRDQRTQSAPHVAAEASACGHSRSTIGADARSVRCAHPLVQAGSRPWSRSRVPCLRLVLGALMRTLHRRHPEDRKSAERAQFTVRSDRASVSRGPAGATAHAVLDGAGGAESGIELPGRADARAGAGQPEQSGLQEGGQEAQGAGRHVKSRSPRAT